MMKGILPAFLLLLSTLSHPALAETPYVVLISLDGFRYDYIEKHGATRLAEIADKGVRAERLLSVYPSKTFPNHLSIITGLLPINHGLVNNRFYDSSRPDGDGYAHYSMGKGYQDSTWLSGTPLWNLVEFNGLKAATYFWPESDARIDGALPSYYYHFSQYADYQNRIDQMISWLKQPETSRPHFIAGYFSLTDSMGHKYGPDAKETKQAVKDVDALIGQLYDRLQTLPIEVNLIVLSDHGMAKLDETQTVNVDSLGIPDTFIYEVEGSQTLIYAKKDTSEADIERLSASLEAQSDGRYTVMSDARRREVHLERGSRTGDIMLEVSLPACFSTNNGHISKGGHGFQPDANDMGATFVATGPAFKKGLMLPPMKNLEVYPGIVKLMGLQGAPKTDSDSAIFEQGLIEQ